MFAILKSLLLVLPSLPGNIFTQSARLGKKVVRHSCAFGSARQTASPEMSESASGNDDRISLFDLSGHRKYLNADERRLFLAAAACFSSEIEVFCLLLHYTGCRMSEALGLRPVHLEGDENTLILQTLKQRRRGVFRTVPVPESLMNALQSRCGDDDMPIFDWHRSTAWEKVRAVFARAGVHGPQATSRGVRHGFGVAATSAGIPITLIQRWLGHSRLETTSIYLAITGPEERNYAQRLWQKNEDITVQRERAA